MMNPTTLLRATILATLTALAFYGAPEAALAVSVPKDVNYSRDPFPSVPSSEIKPKLVTQMQFDNSCVDLSNVVDRRNGGCIKYCKSARYYRLVTDSNGRQFKCWNSVPYRCGATPPSECRY